MSPELRKQIRNTVLVGLGAFVVINGCSWQPGYGGRNDRKPGMEVERYFGWPACFYADMWRAFEASHTTVFVYHADRLIGFGRAISDGVYQAAIYDCAVLPEFQGKGIGTTIMKNILLRISHCNIILYASPGKEGFYQTHGFRKMKTGMAIFKKAGAMREGGFTE